MIEGRGTFLVYGAGANQVPVLEACRRQGWRIVAIDRDPKAPGSALADRFVCASLRDHERILLEVEDEVLCGVVARVTDRGALESSRRIAAERGLAAPCSRLLAASTSKVILAEMSLATGLPTPRRYADGVAIDFERGPVILRPDVTVRGKAGIYRVDSARVLADLKDVTASQSANGGVDVSEWVEGADVSVLVQLDRGKAKRLVFWDEWVAIDRKGRIVGLGAGTPSFFEEKEDAIDATLNVVAKTFPDSRCLITLSLRIDPEGQPWLIEIHLGVGGDAIADQLLPSAFPGFDAFESLITVQAGERGSAPRDRARARGLLRKEDGWQLIQARDPESLRRLARASVPGDWELPWTLRQRREG